ncbi:TetR/AcrR family transcriptional regulator [Nocardia terpenica]|uniref:TetR family transcriptional regulator n=1 Tax=Nocardia terpenica TaxID=455432 RepID=A0A6G9ZCP8_9NOCA|nr:TetR/AcrR family transcriptional regulator [Nocardia terpenica]QIS23385.1 TetR family transcriptional regulator [Nocardia terpenica]
MDPRATNDDLTARARIRNAALDLFAEYGESRVSLRTVAASAGTTVGLVQHHFKTKEGLSKAVDQLVVDYFAYAVASVPATGTTAEVAASRDAAVRRMLRDNPAVVNYVRRAVLEPSTTRLHLLKTLIDLTRHEVTTLRKSGLASTTRPESHQILAVLVRQLGELLLSPMVDAVWERVAEPDAVQPWLSITVTTEPPP